MAATPSSSFLSRHSNRLLMILLILVSLLALVPGSIGFGIRQWLGSQGLTDSYLMDVDFNPFAGTLRLEDLKARKPLEPSKAATAPLELRLAELDVDWWPLVHRQVVVRALHVSGLELALVQTPAGILLLNGIPLPLAGPAESGKAPADPGWGLGIDKLEIEGSRIRLELPDFRQPLFIERLVLSDLRSWQADQPAKLSLRLRVADTPVQLEAAIRPFAATRTLTGQLRIEGLALAPLAADLKARLPAGLLLHSGRLDLDLTGEAQLGERGMLVDQQGDIALKSAQLSLDDRELAVDSLDWRGRLQWSGSKGPAAEGTVTAAGLSATEPTRQLLLGRLEQLQIPGLRLGEGMALEVDGMTLRNPTLLAPLDDERQALFSASQLQLGETRAKGAETLQLGELAVQDARIQLALNKAGRPELLDRLQGPIPAAAPAEPSPQVGVPLRLALAGVQLSGDSRVQFHDLSAQPPFQQTLVLKQLTLGPLDSGDSGQPTPIALAGRIGDYSQITLSGEARPFADKLNLRLNGKIKAVELPPLSSYTAPRLGYNLQSGQLDSDIDLKIRDDQLDGEAKLVLNKLAVKAADPEQLAQLTAELGMPLDTALNMLRDSDDNIRLTLPVTGDVHSPDFDLSQIINKAMGKALKTAALTYVKFALQPYGTLLTLAMKAGQQAQQAALQPVGFDAGSAVLTGDAIPYLGKLAGLLKDRPKLRVRICGMAVEADRQSMLAAAEARRQQELAKQPKTAKPQELPPIEIPVADLLQLATERAEAVKRNLVDQGVTPERLFLCNPELDKEAGAAPRADLLL